MRILSAPSSRRDPGFAPIPRRYPPLRWRRPAWIWAPAAVTLGLGWPALSLWSEPGLMQAALITGFGAFILAMVSMGLGSAFGLPPRTRRAALLHVLCAGAIAAAAAPFVFQAVLDYLAGSERNLVSAGLGGSVAWAMAPLALMLGLPMALFAGLAFTLVAFVKPRTPSWSEAVAPLTHVPIVVTDLEAETAPQRPARTPQLADDSSRS